MKYHFGKIFKKLENDLTKIEIISYEPDNDNYYSLIKKYREKGYSQVIISSKLMIAVLEKFFFEKKCTINSIEMLEDDYYLKQKLNNILEKIKEDRAYFGILVNEINYLVEESSIEIKKVEFSWRENNESISVFIILNGIIGISNHKYSSEVENLAKILNEKFQ